MVFAEGASYGSGSGPCAARQGWTTTTQTKLLPSKGVSCGPLAKGAAPVIYRYPSPFFITGQPGAPIPGTGIRRVYFLSEAPRTETPRGVPCG